MAKFVLVVSDHLYKLFVDGNVSLDCHKAVREGAKKHSCHQILKLS